MAKKKTNIDLEDDDELIEEISDETTDNTEEIIKEEDNQEPESPIDLGDDDEIHDDVIEIDDEDLNFDKPEETQDDVVLSKHTLQGKHSLKYDSIFKGKKEDPLTEDSSDANSGFNENFEVDKSSHYWFESVDNENYVRQKRIKEKVYEVLTQHTDINFLNNRRN